MVVTEGRGLTPGQTIDIVVDGEVVGSGVADDEGNFEIMALGPQREVSSVQGEAVVHLETDSALHVAFQTVLEQARAQATSTSN